MKLIWNKVNVNLNVAIITQRNSIRSRLYVYRPTRVQYDKFTNSSVIFYTKTLFHVKVRTTKNLDGQPENVNGCPWDNHLFFLNSNAIAYNYYDVDKTSLSRRCLPSSLKKL